jgi:imidazolonepropionase-like amidohydrolase
MRAFLILLILPLGLAACGGDDPEQTVSSSPSPAEAATLTPAPASLVSPTRIAGALAIINARLIDGTGAPALAKAHIITGNGRIIRVDISNNPPSLPPGYEVVDAEGRTVIPGLIDGHVHVTRTLTGGAETALLSFLEAGFTSLRDIGTATALLDPSVTLTEGLTEQGLSPRLFWAGPIITAENGYPLTLARYAPVGEAVASPEEAAALVGRLADEGARIIKIGLEKGYLADEGWPLLDLETVRAITDRAHERGMLVTAHITSMDELRVALDGGVDNLAHAPLEPIPDDMMREMLSQSIGIVTTATVWGARQEVAAANARRYADAGGVISIGTDYGCCNQVAGIEPYLREIQFLNQAGMTSMQLITAATRGGAVVAGIADDTGTIEAGKRADILILDRDPTVDLGALAEVRTVVLGGRVVFSGGE